MMAHYNLGNGLENLGELEQATKEYAKAVELSNRSPFTLSFYASCLIRTGRLDEGKAILNEMLDVAKRGVSIGLWIAWVYESMGHKEETIRWLESAIESKEPMLIALHTVWFPFKGLRGDSKYLSILDRLSPQIRSVVLSHLHMV